jgi:hypothetical protein
MDKDLADRLFDPTFSSCRSQEEFDLAWKVQSRLAEAVQKGGRHAPPAPKDRHTIIRRQASERDADLRLRAQYDRADAEVHESDMDDALEYAAVVAEVPAMVRIDGWTAWRRTMFLEKLEEHGSILAAARAVGMSRRSVYRLLPRAPAFAAAFEAAVARVAATLADTLFDRAIHGHQVPILHGGDVVATRTIHHDMLGLHLLRMRDPLNYAPPGEAERWLAGHGLKPLNGRKDPAALPPASPQLPHPQDTPPTGDLCDLVQESGPEDTPATGDLRDLVQETPAGSRRGKPAGLRRSAAGTK